MSPMKPNDDVHGEMRQKAISRLAGFAKLSEGDVERLADIAGPPVVREKGSEIRSEDDSPACLNLLLSGWAASAFTLANGARQLTSISLPGDILGLPTLAMAAPIDSVIAVTDVVTCNIPVDELAELFLSSPRLAFLMFLVSQEERSLAMEKIALLGGTDARTRMAAFFVRLQERHAQLCEEQPMTFFMPLTQTEIGDLVGISAVHVNGLLKDLRTESVMEISKRELHIHDHRTLCEIAQVLPWERSEPGWLPEMK